MKRNVLAVGAVVLLLVGGVLGALIVETQASDSDGSEDYWFYLYFSKGDERNGWYEGTAENANDAFGDAMGSAGFDWKPSSWGYIATIDGEGGSNGWYLCMYLYNSTNSIAQDASTTNQLFGTGNMAGVLTRSDGWCSVNGYNDASFKLSQFSTHVFFFSVYDPSVTNFSAPSPVTVSDWKNSGPFAD